MKDFFEYKLVSSFFGLVNGWDITFGVSVMPTVIAENINNSFL